MFCFAGRYTAWNVNANQNSNRGTALTLVKTSTRMPSSKKTSNLMNHTIIIRTRNRPSWIEKTLNFYKHFAYEGTIYFVDDSDSPQFEQNQKLIARFDRHLRIKHEQGAGAMLPSRIDRVREGTGPALKKVDTDFFSFSSDDDFLFPDFISEAIGRLNRNKEYSAVHGPEIKIHYDKKGNIIEWIPKPWTAHLHDDPIDRLLDFVHTISLAYYGVCRTSSLKYFHEFEKRNGRLLFSRKNTGFGWYDEEIPYVLYIHIVGKVDYLKSVPMGVRGIHESPDRIENFKLADGFDEFTVGPLFSLAKPNASLELHTSLEDLVQVVQLVGSKYDQEYVRRTVYKIFWALLSGNRSGLPDMHADYWLCRFGTNIVQRHQKKLLRFCGRQFAKMHAYKTIKLTGSFVRFENANRTFVEKQ